MSSGFYTRQQYMTSVLNSIGNSNPSPQVVNWMVNWSAQEGNSVGNQGQFNLLNTTQPEAGSYGGGSQGNIQYFNSYQSGVQATATTLQNGNYPDILNALRTNNSNALATGSGNIINEMRTWGTGWNAWYANNPGSGLLSQQFPLLGTTVGSTTSSTNNSSTGASIGGITLPSVTDIVNFTDRFTLFFFGGLIIIIGISIAFFANQKKTASQVNPSDITEAAAA